MLEVLNLTGNMQMFSSEIKWESSWTYGPQKKKSNKQKVSHQKWSQHPHLWMQPHTCCFRHVHILAQNTRTQHLRKFQRMICVQLLIYIRRHNSTGFHLKLTWWYQWNAALFGVINSRTCFYHSVTRLYFCMNCFMVSSNICFWIFFMCFSVSSNIIWEARPSIVCHPLPLWFWAGLWNNVV